MLVNIFEEDFGVVYITDHEVAHIAQKYVVGHWTPSWNHFGLHQRKNKCKSDHEPWGSQKAYFYGYIVHCFGPTGFAMGEAKEVLSLQISRDDDKEMSFIYMANCVS